MTINELREKAMSKDGVWVYALQENRELFFPNAPEEENNFAMKIYVGSNSVRVYSIWENGLPCLEWYAAKDAFFEETPRGIRFTTSGRGLVEVARQHDKGITKEEFQDWFLQHLEITKKEYDEIVTRNGKKGLPRIRTIGGAREEDEEEDYY